MNDQPFPPEFLKLLHSVKGKRPRTVIKHILKHGRITTEELKELYGYNHPPRAIRDVRELGIPIKTFRVTGSDRRKIAGYRFGDPSEVRATHLSGRTKFSSHIKDALISKFGPRCNIYLTDFPERQLQIDHRIPYEVAGDQPVGVVAQGTVDEYMLLSPSANRAKSWSCENCPNWHLRSNATCRSCYWAYPEDYQHVAMQQIRRLDISWSGAEIDDYERLRVAATMNDATMPDYVKRVLLDHFRRREQ